MIGLFSGPRSFFNFLADVFCSTRTLRGLLILQFMVVGGAFIGVVIWRWVDEPFGHAGLLVVIFISVTLLSLLLWFLLLGKLLLFYPLPICRQGHCSTLKDYSWDRGTLYGRVKWACYIYRCRCGDHYLLRRNKFMVIIPPCPSPGSSDPGDYVVLTENNTRPYKRLVEYRQWEDDINS